MGALKQRNIVIPAYTTLQTWLQGALTTEEKRIERCIRRYLNTKTRNQLDVLLTTDCEHNLQALKTDPKNFRYQQMQQHLKAFAEYFSLYQHIIIVMPRLRLSKQSIAYYASLIDYYNRYELNDIKQHLAYLYLLCYVYHRLRLMMNHIIEGTGFHINKHQQQAKKYTKAEWVKKVQEVHQDLPKGGQLLRLYNDKQLYDKPFKTIASEAHLILPQEQLLKLCHFLERKDFDTKKLYWEYYEEKQKTITQNLRPLFKAINFTFGKGQQPLQKALRFLHDTFDAKKSLAKQPDNKFPRAFIPRHLKSMIIDEQNAVRVSRYEFCVYLCLYNKLEEGFIHCNDSIQYRDFDKDTREAIDWDDPKTQAAIIKELDIDELSMPIEKILSQYETRITERYDTVNQRIRDKVNTSVKVKKTEEGVNWRQPFKKQKSSFNNPFYDQTDQENIGHIMEFVENQVHYLRVFTALKQYRSKTPLNKGVTIACILANALGYGSHEMSKISNFTYKILFRTEKSRVRIDNIREANDILINAYLALPIVKRYNVADGLLWSNADGQKYKTVKDTLKSRNSPKYYGLGTGVVSYSSTMNHIAIATKIIGANEHESHHLIELMSLNTSDASIDCVATVSV